MIKGYVKMNLREIQFAQLAILKKFDFICKELNLKYYLYYGTLIGAVRHNGFIPWDDDIDVIMPRNDYEVFLSYAKEHLKELSPYCVCHYSIDADYVYPIMRFCNTEYKVNYHNIKGYGQGLFMDIYPIDGCGTEYKKSIQYLKYCSFRSLVTSLAGMEKLNPSSKGRFMTVIKKGLFKFAHIIGSNRLSRNCDKFCQKKKYEECKYVACALWPYYGIKDLAEKKDLEECIMTEFEGEMFPIPKAYDKHLKRIYGNYMVLPQESERIAHHYYTAYQKVK